MGEAQKVDFDVAKEPLVVVVVPPSEGSSSG
jgi:hypothetical protein